MGRDRRLGQYRRSIRATSNTWGLIFDPPPELAGKINVVPEMDDILAGAVIYVGGEPCTDDKAMLEEGARHAGGRQAQMDRR